MVRFNREMGANFEKEVFVARTLAPRVPIPPILRRGRLGELRYAVSPLVAGTALDRLPPAEFEALTPALVATLDAVHAVDVGGTVGSGTFGDDGARFVPSWRGYPAAIRDEEPTWDFHGAWHALFETTFLERDLFDRVYARMAGHLARCPEERWLLHGNDGFGNVLARDGEIVAALDWIDAKYGDFVYDVAWLDFWAPGAGMAGVLGDHDAARGTPVPDDDERLRCYRDYLGLDALRFFAKAGDEKAYRWARERLLAAD